MILCGRTAERLIIDELLAAARAGHSGTVAFRGEAGIGKSALLEYAAATATGMRVLRASGVETEAEFAFAGLHMLLRPALDRVPELPRPQAAALRRAFGAADAEGAQDQFLAGLAVLSLLSDLAEERPVLCLVDDAHWLDRASAQALLFAMRRLDADPVAVIMAARDHPPPFGVPQAAVRLTGLTEAAADQLLDERAPQLQHAARVRVLAEAAGNPLALVELAREAADGGPPDGGPVPLVAARVPEVYASQLGQLGESARTMMLLGAAEPTGDLATIVAAAVLLGTDPAALDDAERADLVTVTSGRLEFRHPLLRSAAYHGAPLARRHAAHRALAAGSDDGPPDQADRRAWHLAAAVIGHDEQVAAQLEATAERARQRGGYAAVCAAYERAAELTSDPSTRAGRLLAAAIAANDAGLAERAEQLAGRACELPHDDLSRAKLALLRATMPSADGASRFAELSCAATAIADRDPALAASMLALVSHSAWIDHHHGRAVESAAKLQELLPASADGTSSFAEAVSQQALLFVDAPAADRRIVQRYLAGIGRDHAETDPGELLAATVMALWDGSYDLARQIATGLADRCRTHGMIGWLPGVLYDLNLMEIQLGDWGDAKAGAVEALRLAIDTGQPARAAALARLLGGLAALAGDRDGVAARTAEAESLDPAVPAPVSAVWLHGCLATLDLAEGQFESARNNLVLADQLWGDGTAFLLQPDMVEAAVRAGDSRLAHTALTWYERWAEEGGHQWARSVAHRCRALVSAYDQGDDDRAEEHYTEAIRLHEGQAHPYKRARTHLVYGEWLRRNRRRADARVQLTMALEIFEHLGAASWSRRTRSELAAAGTSPDMLRGRSAGMLAGLTAQELQVARLAARGLSNRDIAAQLFLSPRTVGYHLYKVYPKLGVSSRGKLNTLFSTEDR